MARRRAATSSEERELQLTSKAYDLVEERIDAGTASSQELTFFLKMGSSRERLEQAKIGHEIELMKVKKDAEEGRQRIEELFVKAIDAIRGYGGSLNQGSVDGSVEEG